MKMMKRMIYIMCLVLTMGLAGGALAAEIIIVPTGTGDDATLIQTTLNGLGNGDILRLNGNFVIGRTIYLPSNFTWILTGSLTLKNNAVLDRVGYVDPSKGIDARRYTGISEKSGGAANIDMSGGTYYGNCAHNSSSLRFLNFASVTNSYFHDMVITDVSDDNFTLGPGCNNNECRNLIGSFSASGNALTDKGDHNTWYDCIAADCGSDGWTPKCQYSIFIRCIASNNKGPGFGMYAREEGYAGDVGALIIGNQFIDCVSYGSKDSDGFSFNISSNCPGAVIRGNFTQAVCYDNQGSGVKFRNKDDAEQGVVEDNVVDVVCYGNRGLSSSGSQNSWAGGLGMENDNSALHNTIDNIAGSVVCYDNRIDVNTKGGQNCIITAYHPEGENAPILADNSSYNNTVTVIDFNCSDSLYQWCEQEYCGLTPCAGLADFNCDGNVNMADLSYMASVWLTDDPTADISLPTDGVVNLLDLSILSLEWFQ
ncbi:MAG: hypothetical protein FJ263_09405 [Planctomycetes bacterium]|nr:hypothetical protein [Planctomycetota bacterium]